MGLVDAFTLVVKEKPAQATVSVFSAVPITAVTSVPLDPQSGFVQVKVAVTVDLEEAVYAEAAKFALFYMSRLMICQLIDLASGAGVRHTEDVCLSGSLPVRFKESPRLAYLEKHLGRFAGKRRGQPPKEERTGGEEEILIYPGKNPAQEVRFICHQIHMQ